FRFTDRTRFPPKGEIGFGAAFLEVDPMDTMDIVCPKYNNSSEHSAESEWLIIYQVSDLSFMNCELDSRSQVFLVCDSPLRKIPPTHRIVFRPFSPLPNGFEYQPGRSYYFISTSNGSLEGMNNTRRGLCMSHNLRLRIDVRPINESAVPFSSAEVGYRDINPKFIRPHETSEMRNHDEPSSHVQARKPLDEISNEVNNANIDESILFAAKHGLDLNRLEYVRQLARDGAEGDFPFVQLADHHDDMTAPVAIHSAEGRHNGKESSLRMIEGDHRTRGSSNGEWESPSNRQAQRWISSEDQKKYGDDPSRTRNYDADSKEDVQSNVDDRQDYLVDETSSVGSTMSTRRSLLAVPIFFAYRFALQR
uniref:Ephrin RBD domain-containing protein n=1 Tax=Parascaris univalens TaxID=6257 RepID=A0A915CII8_PARUN